VPQLRTFEGEILRAVGLADEDIILFDAPVRVETLLTSTPMFSAPDYVHPELEEIWQAVGDALVSSAPERAYPRRIFCSRGGQRRACSNASEVESLFAAHGFAVVFPEDFEFAEQARMFREAEVVAGFAGSGLLGLMFSGHPKRLIMLSPASYTARNEYMICSVLGHEMDVVWSEPDVGHPPGGWSAAAVRSGFTFDFEREGTFLKGLLTSL
jgi:capsular polysaccharide biosynthesis protein